MEDFLKAVDESIKRLLTPVSVLIGAAFLLKGLENPDSSSVLIYALFTVLCIWALAYTIVSGGIAVKKIFESIENKPIAYTACLSFMPVYLVLIISAIWLGFEKIAIQSA